MLLIKITIARCMAEVALTALAGRYFISICMYCVCSLWPLLVFITVFRAAADNKLDCKTVRIFAYSSTREQSDKRSGMRLKTESETGERRFPLASHARRACEAHHALPISLLILRKKTTVLQSNNKPEPRRL